MWVTTALEAGGAPARTALSAMVAPTPAAPGAAPPPPPTSLTAALVARCRGGALPPAPLGDVLFAVRALAVPQVGLDPGAADDPAPAVAALAVALLDTLTGRGAAPASAASAAAVVESVAPAPGVARVAVLAAALLWDLAAPRTVDALIAADAVPALLAVCRRPGLPPAVHHVAASALDGLAAHAAVRRDVCIGMKGV
jgi:hypothetical protein